MATVKKRTGVGVLLAGGTAGLLAASVAVSQPPVRRSVDFGREVLPILRGSCFQCHGMERQDAGLRLDTRERMLKGGLHGATLLPGKGKESLLVRRINGHGGLPRMPLGFAPLSPAQTETLRLWIDSGANWSDSANGGKHWAYKKPAQVSLPKVKNRAWCRNPIDYFVLARLEKSGLKPSVEAMKETLLRRVTLDLTGIVPTIAEIDAFLADRSPNAYEKVVDRLLASPHYGERTARPWLDLARYADTNGYEKDGMRSIWPYRDWVINALNRDMPFDQFTIEQIAGDMLPNATLEQKIATGFHRNTMLNEEGGVDRAEQRWLTQVDRVGTTGTVWLGTTLACTQCHNHKYDPFTQKEFYQILAFFDRSTEPALEVVSPEQEAKRTALKTEIAQQEETVKRLMGEEKEALKAAQIKLSTLKAQLEQMRFPSTLVMQEPADTTVPTAFTRIKGAFLSKGEQVTAGTPAVLNPLPAGVPRNRLGLAQWLVSRDNPLTARVAVNRVWEQMFGRGIVETSEDFGIMGQRPTHPELLDWLAVNFSTHWSLKKLHRLIVTSATYRQASVVTPALLERDPFNHLLARGPRFRLEAEMIRDAAFSASGLLSRKIGGASVFPVQPEGIWDVPYSGEKWNTSTGEDRYRRSIYTFWRRSAPYPAFTTFDATSREFCTVRRIRTNTPLQALTTLNDPALFEAARTLAKRAQEEGGKTPNTRIAHAFRLCLTRRPRPAELTRLLNLYSAERARYTADTKSALSLTGIQMATPELPETAALLVVANILLNLDEALTKE